MHHSSKSKLAATSRLPSELDGPFVKNARRNVLDLARALYMKTIYDMRFYYSTQSSSYGSLV